MHHLAHRARPWRAVRSGVGGALLTAVLALASWMPAAAAAQNAAACKVFSSGLLQSNDRVFSYEGGCSNGWADGQGLARWSLRHAPDAEPLRWQGRFSDGVFLADAAVRSARRIDPSRALLDLGKVAGPGGAEGRIWVEAMTKRTQPPRACDPVTIQLQASGPLVDDAIAQGWLNAALATWRGVCPRDELDTHLRMLRFALQDGTLAPDSYGNLPRGAVSASIQIAGPGQGRWLQYSNHAAQLANRQRQASEHERELQANRARLLAFAERSGAHQYVELQLLDQNPFRFQDQTVLVAVQLVEARTAGEAVVHPAHRDRYDWTRALVRGDIAQWDGQSRLIAARVMGRSDEEYSRGALLLRLQDSVRCDAPDCEDYLLMPGNQWLHEQRLP